MKNVFLPAYTTRKCSELTDLECYAFSLLFSSNYGRWSGKDNPDKAGKRIKLPSAYYEKMRQMNDMYVSACKDDDILIGACFFLKKTLENKQTCVWITQLVVDNSYRKRGIATRLLQSAWGFSDYFAWGLATANTLTVKTLESVTWRKVEPLTISEHLDSIRQLCESLPYKTNGIKVSNKESYIDTNFFIEREIHSEVENVYLERLGELPDGYEWLAFTFKSQEMIYDAERFDKLLEFSAEQLNDAYSRMDMSNQSWTKGTVREVDALESLVHFEPSATILDVGCGQGRHSIELAKRGYNVTGIDTSSAHIRMAKKNADGLNVDFKVWDARKRLPGKSFDYVICLYDVVGSYRTLDDNVDIIRRIAQKLHKGGIAVLSVMNMTHIKMRAIHRGNVRRNPKMLLELPASNYMQKTGNMFDPHYLLLDEEEHLVYHKEQFEQDGSLSAEYIVADYRFTSQELTQILQSLGFEILEKRFVSAGHFEMPLAEEDDKAKECLFVVRKV
jgi:2-polyprenyl-3-methyl-5-hydroxy-6-metoxy-1,4-benzoquinol methylase